MNVKEAIKNFPHKTLFHEYKVPLCLRMAIGSETEMAIRRNLARNHTQQGFHPHLSDIRSIPGGGKSAVSG